MWAGCQLDVRVGLVKFGVFWVLKKVKMENWFGGGHIWKKCCMWGLERKFVW